MSGHILRTYLMILPHPHEAHSLLARISQLQGSQVG